MRYATLRSQEFQSVEVSVVTLGGAAGGELANVNRWRAQVGLAPLDEAALAKERLEVASEVGPIAVYDLTGKGEGGARMVAGLLNVPGGSTWFFKLTGDAKTVDAVRPVFLRLLATVHRA